MARYLVEFKAFKSGEWYTKTETDFINSAYSVLRTESLGRSGRIIDNADGTIVEEQFGSNSIYEEYGHTA